MDAIDKQLASALSMLDQLSFDPQEKDQDCSQISSQNSKLLHELENRFQNEIENLNLGLEKSRNVTLKLRSENEKLRESLGSARREFEVIRMQERTDFLEKIRDLENKITGITAVHVPEADERCRKLQKALDQKTFALSNLEMENDEIRTKFLEKISEKDSNNRASIRQIAELKLQAEELNSQKEQLNQQFESAMNEIKTWAAKNKEASENLAAAQKQTNDVRYSMEEKLQTVNAHLHTISSKATMDKIEWEQQLKESARQVDTLSNELQSLHSSLVCANQTRKELECHLRDENERLKSERECLAQKFHCSLRKNDEEINNLREELDTKKKELLCETEGWSQRSSSLQLQLKESRSEAEIMQRKINDLKQEHCMFQKREETYQTEMVLLHKKISELNDEITGLRTQLNFNIPQLQQEKEETERLRKKTTKLQQELDSVEESNRQCLEQAKSTWSKAVIELKESLQKTQNDKKKYQETCNKVKQAALKRIQDLRESNCKLQVSLDKEKQRHKNIKSTLEQKINDETKAKETEREFREEFVKFIQSEVE